MSTPSIKAIKAAFPYADANYVKLLLTSMNAVRNHPAAIEVDRQCHHRLSNSHLRMSALNAELDMHGVEYVEPGTNQKSPGFSYLNSGDTYNATIIRLYGGGYRIACVGDMIERRGANYK